MSPGLNEGRSDLNCLDSKALRISADDLSFVEIATGASSSASATTSSAGVSSTGASSSY